MTDKHVLQNSSPMKYLDQDNFAPIETTKEELLKIKQSEHKLPYIPRENYEKYKEIIRKEYEEKITEKEEDIAERKMITMAAIIAIIAMILVTIGGTRNTPYPLFVNIFASLFAGAMVFFGALVCLSETEFCQKSMHRQDWEVSSAEKYQGIIPEEALKTTKTPTTDVLLSIYLLEVETFAKTPYNKKNLHFLKEIKWGEKTASIRVIAYWED